MRKKEVGKGGQKGVISGPNSHGYINMVHAINVVTCAKDYGSSQPDLGKEATPPESPLRIEKPMIFARILCSNNLLLGPEMNPF